MKTARPRSSDTLSARTPQPNRAAGRVPAQDTLAAAQRNADQSQAVGALDTLQRRASGVLQRETDTSSSPFLPDYDEDETPAWMDDGGVPNWAKRQYKQDAPRTMIVSVADNKIGSIYFPGGRIRTTHSEGPTKEKHGQTLQYNIDYDTALAEFDSKNPDYFTKVKKILDKKYKKDPNVTQDMIKNAAYDYYWTAQDKYIAEKLNVTDPKKLPAWVGDVITSPSDAPDMDKPTTDTLFEVFRSINGSVESWHPSRGAAKKWVTNKQVVSVLHAAIAHIKDIKGANARNTAFYEFIKSRLPDFVKNIRKPDEV
ncbi:MAG: hypothetical protein AAGA94_03445 [Pseudomonadota bacterium]